MRFVKLKDIASLTEGYKQNMTSAYRMDGVPFLRSLNIAPFEILNKDLKFISEEFHNELKKSQLHTNDVIMVRTGNPGTCCVVTEAYSGANCSDVIIIRPNLTVVSPLYLAAYINTFGRSYIERNVAGAVQKHFYLHSAKDLPIALPELSKQEHVALLIEQINRYMDLNSQINDNLPIAA